jgi:hypothetical protein
VGQVALPDHAGRAGPALVAPGALSSVDRTAYWEVIPSYLLGADYIQTENDDKQPLVTGEKYSVFLGMGGSLHVFVDQRLGAPSAGNQLTWLIDGSVVAGGFTMSGNVVLQDSSSETNPRIHARNAYAMITRSRACRPAGVRARTTGHRLPATRAAALYGRYTTAAAATNVVLSQGARRSRADRAGKTDTNA